MHAAMIFKKGKRKFVRRDIGWIWVSWIIVFYIGRCEYWTENDKKSAVIAILRKWSGSSLASAHLLRLGLVRTTPTANLRAEHWIVSSGSDLIH